MSTTSATKTRTHARGATSASALRSKVGIPFRIISTQSSPMDDQSTSVQPVAQIPRVGGHPN